MPVRLNTQSADFETRFAQLLSGNRDAAHDVDRDVTAILADVAARGDAALLEYTARFDRLATTAEKLRFTDTEIDAAVARCDRTTLDALEMAAMRIEAFHRRLLPQDDRFTDAVGVSLGHRWTALAAVGLYVPGGTASYPSSVLMNAIPARVAGVPRRVMVMPTPDGGYNPLALAAAATWVVLILIRRDFFSRSRRLIAIMS